MNKGTTGQSNDDLAQQRDSQQLFKDYYSTVLPAMGYVVRNVAGSKGASDIAAGKAAGSAYEAGGTAMASNNNRSSNAGALPGSGAYGARTGAIMAGTAKTAGVGSGVARVGPQANTNRMISGAVQTGTSTVQNALRSLDSETGIQDATLEADTTNKAMPLQQLTGLGLSAGMALLAA